jgi:hypothetical protein
MRRPARTVGLAVAVLVIAFAATGCGAVKVDGMTAADIVAKSNDAMKTVKSAAFYGSLQITVRGDKEKAGDPTSALLLGTPIGLTISGAVSEDPTAMRATIEMPLLAMVSPGAETIEERVLGQDVYMRLRDQWYALSQPASTAPEPGPTASVSTEEFLGGLKRLGVDLETWVREKKDVTAEQLDGREVYHVSEEIDVAALANGLAKLVANADALQQLVPAGQGQATGHQLEMLKSQSGQIAQSLQEYLRGASVDLWIETGTFYLDKIALTADIGLPPEAAQRGVDGAKFDMSMGFSEFNEPVQVEKPADAKRLPLDPGGVWTLPGAGGQSLPGQSTAL